MNYSPSRNLFQGLSLALYPENQTFLGQKPAGWGSDPDYGHPRPGTVAACATAATVPQLTAPPSASVGAKLLALARFGSRGRNLLLLFGKHKPGIA